MEALPGFPSPALGFAAIVSLWRNHRALLAHYPIDDHRKLALGSILLFVVVLYVYSFKVLMQFIAESLLGAQPRMSLAMGLTESRGLHLVFATTALPYSLCSMPTPGG